MAPSVATNTEVGLEQLLEFVRPRHRMVLLTKRADGTPQASPVTGGVDDSGRIVVATYPQRAKTRNARQRPEVSVVVLSDEWDGAWVQVDGACEVLDATDGDEALDAFVEYFRNISGEHSDWDQYRTAMVEQGKSLLRITPTRWGTVSTGGFPPRSPNAPDGRAFSPFVTMERMQTQQPAQRHDAWQQSALLVGAFVAVLWGLEIVDTASGHALDAYGVQPRARTASSASCWRRCCTSASTT